MVPGAADFQNGGLKMTLEQAIAIVTQHNAWRRDNTGKIPMYHSVRELSTALDTLLAHARASLNGGKQ